MNTIRIMLVIYLLAAVSLSFLGSLALVIHEAYVSRKWRRGDLWTPDGTER